MLMESLDTVEEMVPELLEDSTVDVELDDRSDKEVEITSEAKVDEVGPTDEELEVKDSMFVDAIIELESDGSEDIALDRIEEVDEASTTEIVELDPARSDDIVLEPGETTDVEEMSDAVLEIKDVVVESFVSVLETSVLDSDGALTSSEDVLEDPEETDSETVVLEPGMLERD